VTIDYKFDCISFIIIGLLSPYSLFSLFHRSSVFYWGLGEQWSRSPKRLQYR